MDSVNNTPVQKVKVTIDRGDEEQEDQPVILKFTDLDDLEVILSDSSVNDIKILFNSVFEYISSNKKLIEFELDDSDKDLFTQVSQDIIDQLNVEIKESEENFAEIWELLTTEQ